MIFSDFFRLMMWEHNFFANLTLFSPKLFSFFEFCGMINNVYLCSFIIDNNPKNIRRNQMTETFTRAASVKDAANGDLNAFAQLYSADYKKIYYIAYYSLANPEEAAEAVITAVRLAYATIGGCKSREDFTVLILRKTCEQIITKYREYRKTPPHYENKPSYIKSQMLKLTDAERLSVTIWAVFGYDEETIAEVTGLSQAIVVKKLESGKAKLAEKV